MFVRRRKKKKKQSICCCPLPQIRRRRWYIYTDRVGFVREEETIVHEPLTPLCVTNAPKSVGGRVCIRGRERERGRPLHDAPILPVVQMWWVSSVCRLVLSSLLFLYIYISLLLLLTMTAVSLDRTSSNIRHRIDELRISFVARASHHSS